MVTTPFTPGRFGSGGRLAMRALTPVPVRLSRRDRIATLAQSMNDRFAPLRQATRVALFGGSGVTPPELLQVVARGTPPPELAVLVRKIRDHAYKVTDADVDALRDRFTEDQLFEIIVAAAYGAAEERLDAGRRALEQA